MAMGWWNSHLHQFIVGERYYGVPHSEYGDIVDMQDEEGVTLGQVAPGEGKKIRYEYDFGDGWMHDVLVEKVVEREPDQDYPVCIKGRRACPPEDVGGIWGYANFLEAIANPDNEEHGMYLEWVGGEFDPEAFDLNEVNWALGGVSRMKKLEQRPRRHDFCLNPFVDWRATSCPSCQDKTRLRKFPLVVQMVPDGLVALNWSCRYCPSCDLIIVHRDELDAELAAFFGERDISQVSGRYVVVGTIDRAVWRQGLKKPLSEDELLDQVYVFERELDVEPEPYGWMPEG
jgi:hypothetical protein